MIPARLIAAIVHGLAHVSLAMVIGGLVLDRFVVPAGARELGPVRLTLRRWITGALIVLAMTGLADLPVRAQAMSGAALSGVLDTIPQVIRGTHVGVVCIARVVVIALTLLLSLARGAALRTLCLVAALGVAVTTSLSSHAAEWGDVTATAGLDWVHAIAASVWAGGLIMLVAVLGRGQPRLPPPALGVIAGRFSRLAGACVVLVVATGLYNAWVQLGPIAKLWTTPYGRVLGLKVLAVAALVWLGALNRYDVVPWLGPARRSRGLGARLFVACRFAVLGSRRKSRTQAPTRLITYLTAETLLALIVFAFTAVLGEATPGRHVERIGRPSTHVTNKEVIRRSSESLLGGTVTPPPGDAAKGRLVFVKLRCFDCHAVNGESFPAPGSPGPDLSGVGRGRHPGYLLESIVNPNALVVDGPGFSDAAGASTMPDYRERLSVGELIDIVAYLKTLDAAREPTTR